MSGVRVPLPALARRSFLTWVAWFLGQTLAGRPAIGWANPPRGALESGYASDAIAEAIGRQWYCFTIDPAGGWLYPTVGRVYQPALAAPFAVAAHGPNLHSVRREGDRDGRSAELVEVSKWQVKRDPRD